MKSQIYILMMALVFLFAACGQTPQTVKPEQKPAVSASARNSALVSPTTAQPLPEDIRAGVRYYNEGKYDEARSSLEQSISAGSVNWQGFYYLGLSCRMLKQYPKASSSFQQALTFAPNDVHLRSDLYAAMAEVSELIGNANQALLQYHMAVNLNPDNLIAKEGYDRLSQHTSR